LSESFDDADGEPADAVTALRAVLERAADGIHRRTIEAENAAREVVGSGTDAGARLGRLAEWGIWLTGAQGAFPPHPLERVTMLSVGIPAPAGHPVHQLAPESGVTMSSVALPTDSTSAQIAELGVVAVDGAIDVGCDLLMLPGLVEDTVSSALVALLLRLSATEVTGESPHLDDRQWAEHVADIRDRTHDARRYDDDPVALLDALGSPELVALVAMLLRAAARRTAVLLDGAADCAAALCASRVSILGSWWWFAAASSSNPATTRAIEALGLDPVLHLASLLDGGAAALTALPLLRAAQQLCRTP
jgi:nicotinate-nucleotide--dimethylbenzimidazole phosphoribosyltransferase